MATLTAPGDLSSLAETRAAQSPAGPVSEHVPVRMAPALALPRTLQTLRFAQRPIGFNLGAQRQLGDVWQLRLASRREPFTVTSHPDHVASLLKAKPQDAPSLTGESPLRPIVRPDSVLTSVGDRHLRQRKLLLGPFHGDAVARYVEMISAVAEREIEGWPIGRQFALAPRMQAVTLEVIMSGVFGIESRPARGTTAQRLRDTIPRLLGVSTSPLFTLVELRNAGRREARGVLAGMLSIVDRHLYAVISQRRADGLDSERHDILSLLLGAAEQRVVLAAIAGRTDLIAPDPAPEPPRQRNVTMIPRGGCQVFVTGRHAAW